MPNRPDYAAGTYAGFSYAGDWVTDLAASSAATSGAAGGLTVAHPMAALSSGASTAAADVRATHPLAGSSAGTSSLGGQSINYKNLAGSSTGTSTVPNAAIVVTHTLIAGSDGLSGASAAVLVAHPLAGTSAGNATLSVALAVSRPLAGGADGASTVSATVTPLRNLTGASDGASTTAADLTDTAPDYILVPRLDVSVNSWTTDTGATTDIYTAIDELTPSDTDYIQSPTGPSAAQYYETAVETRPDPQTDTGHIVHYRYQKTGTGAMDLTVGLYQGTTEIVSWAHTNIGTSWVQQDQTLSAGIANSISNYDDLRLRFTPSQVATANLAPDALLLQTNLVGAVTAIDDDPDAPDASWLTASSTTTASILRVSFPTPALTPGTGAGLQQFRIWVRKTSGSGVPTTTIELWENGVLKSTLLAATNITSTAGQLLSATWDASTLTTASGANVELRLTGTVGGSGANRATMEVGAVEWVVGYPVGKAQVSWANFELPVGGTTWTLDGSSDASSSAGADLRVSHGLIGASDGVSTGVGAAAATWAMAGRSDGTATQTTAVLVGHFLIGQSDGVSSATANTAVAHPLAGVSTGTSSASAALSFAPAALAGTSAGTSGASSALTVGHPLAGSAAGVSTAAAPLTIAHPLAGATDALSSVAGDLRTAHPLAAASAGVSTAGATVIAAWTLAGQSNGTSTDTTGVLVGYLISGRSDGVTGAAATSAVTHPVAGASTGTSAAAAAVTTAHPLAGSSAATSSAAGDIVITHPLAGSSAGTSSASAGVVIAHPLAGTSTGTATVAGDIGLAAVLQGTSAAVGGASANLSATWGLVGQSDGVSTDTTAILVGHLLNGSTAATSTAAANLATAHPLAAGSDGISSGSATATGTFAISAQSAGVSGAAATSGATRPLAGSSAGTSTASAAVTVAHPLAASSAGSGAAAADLLVSHPLVGTASGTATASATASVSWTLAGRSDGISTDTTAVLVGHLLNGQADGQSTVLGDAVVAHPLSGTSSGTSTASGTISNGSLFGAIAGTSSAAADLVVSHALAGSADSVGSVAAAIVVAHPLVGRADGTATASANETATLTLSGTTAGVSGASATVSATWRLAGQSDGAATGTVAILVGHLLDGQTAGQSTVSATMPVAHPLAATTTGTSSAAANLATTHPLAGTATGTSTVAAAELVITHNMAAAAAGTSTASASLVVQFGLVAASTGTSTASAAAPPVAHPLAATSTGTSSLTGETAVAFVLAGRSDGTSTDTTAVLVGHLLDGLSTGASTAAGLLVTAHPLAGSTAGVSTASATLDAAHPLAGATAATSGASATVTPLLWLTGSAAATSGAAADLAIAHPLAANATGTSSAAASVTVGHPLAAAAAGVSGANGAVSATLALAGRSDAVATDTVAVLVGHLLGGQTDGHSTAAGDLAISHPLAGEAGATSTASLATLAEIAGATGGASSAGADLGVTQGLSGTTGGSAGAQGAAVAAVALAGSTASGTVVFEWGKSTFEGGHTFEGRLQEVRAVLSVATSFSGSTGATSSASATPLVYTGIAGTTSGTSSAAATLRTFSNIAGTTGGTSTVSAKFAIDLNGRADGTSTVSGTLEVHILSGRIDGVSSASATLDPIDHPIAGRVNGTAGASASITLPRPFNDDFVNAEVLDPLSNSGGSSTTTLANTTGARAEVGEPAPYAGVGGKSVWYRWTPEIAGTATIDTIGSTFNTTVDVFTGSTLTSLIPVAGDHDAGPGGASQVTFEVEPGRTYRIRVDSFDGSVGALTLHWALALPVVPPPPPPDNDDFINAIDIGKVLVGSMSGTTAGATSVEAEPMEDGYKTVWYKWTAPDYGFMRIKTVKGYGVNDWGEQILPMHGPYLSMGAVIGQPTSEETLYWVDEVAEKESQENFTQYGTHFPEWTEWWAVKGTTYWFGFYDAWVYPPGYHTSGEFTFEWEFRKQRIGPDLPDGGWIAMGWTALDIDNTSIVNPSFPHSTRGWLPVNFFASKDGTNWEVVYTPFDNDWSSYEFIVVDGSTIIAGGWPYWTEYEATMALGLVYSQDGGVTWKAANTPMLGSGQSGWGWSSWGHDFWGEYDTWAEYGLKGNGRFVVAGHVDDNGTDYRGSDAKTVLVSAPVSDPSTWTKADLPFLDTKNSEIWHIAFVGDRYFAEFSTVKYRTFRIENYGSTTERQTFSASPWWSYPSPAPPTGGTYTLSFRGETTDPIPWDDAGAANTAFTALSTVGGWWNASVVVNGGSVQIDFAGPAGTSSLKGQDLPWVEMDASGLTGPDAPYTYVVSSVYEGGEHSVWAYGMTGTYKIRFNGYSTPSLDLWADAATVQAALEALPSIGPGKINVEGPPFGSPGGNMRLRFDDSLVPLVPTKLSLIMTNVVSSGDAIANPPYGYKISEPLRDSIATFLYGSSVDGVTWTMLPRPSWQQDQYAYHYGFQRVYEVNGQWIAYLRPGSYNSPDYKSVSTDKGVTWSAPVANPTVPYSYFTEDVAYNGSRWVAVVITQTEGPGTFFGDKQVAWSDDFETWHPVTTPFSIDARGNSVVGQTPFQPGTRFRNYTGSFAESVSWDGEWFWAAGSNGGYYGSGYDDLTPTVTLARSADGVSWTQIHTPVEQPGPLYQNGQIWQVKKLAPTHAPVPAPPALTTGSHSVGVRR